MFAPESTFHYQSKNMHFQNVPILALLFATVVGLPLLSLVAALSAPGSDPTPEQREPRMVDAAYPSKWLAKGWNRKFLSAPLSCDSLMELYTTSVRHLQERNWKLAKSYSERCLQVLSTKPYGSRELEANIYNNLGVVDFYIGSAQNARTQFERAVQLASESEEGKTYVVANLNLAATLIFLNETNLAKHAVISAREMIIKLDGEESRELIDIKCMDAAIARRSKR